MTTADDGGLGRVTGGTAAGADATGPGRPRGCGLWWNAFRSSRDGDDGDSNTTTTTTTRTRTTSTRTSQHKTESSTEARARGYRGHGGPPKCTTTTTTRSERDGQRVLVTSRPLDACNIISLSLSILISSRLSIQILLYFYNAQPCIREYRRIIRVYG